MSLMSRESYDQANSYEPMGYKPERWEHFNNTQNKQFEYFENQLNQLNQLGYIPQVGRIAVTNNEDFLSRKGEIESKDGFVKWFD